MKLNATKIPIQVGGKYVAVMNERRAHFLDLHPSDRILLKVKGKPALRAVLEITKNGELRDNDIGLYEETWAELKAKYGTDVDVKIAEKPISTTYIKKKLDGQKLNADELNEIIKDVVEEDLTDIEISFFVAGCYTHGLDDEETSNLTKAIVRNGSQLKFKNKIVADKHCIGGVPGNRTTMVIIPIITSTGIAMPKTSSRAITSPAGTADTMEVLANVVNDADKLKKIVSKVGGFITWGGGVDLAAADDKMIRTRQPLSLDPQGMLLASIMAKKFSVSANRVLIDIPIGDQVKIKTKREGRELKRRFLKLGKSLDMKVKVIFTDGCQPIGNGIGPTLEAIDVMETLKCNPEAPQELREKSIHMAGILFKMCGKTRTVFGGKRLAKRILDSGEAYKQMNKIIEAQGKKRNSLKPAKFSKVIKSEVSGIVKGIDNKLLSHVARCAGAPKDANAGVYIYKKVGDKVKKGDDLFTIYATIEERIGYAMEYPYKKIYDIR